LLVSRYAFFLPEERHALVLSTCWPFDALTQGPERYLVHATMIVDAPGSR
jgi:sortase A